MLLGTLLTVAALTAIPARIGARRFAAGIFQSEGPMILIPHAAAPKRPVRFAADDAHPAAHAAPNRMTCVRPHERPAQPQPLVIGRVIRVIEDRQALQTV